MLSVTPLGHGAPGTTKQLAAGQSEGGDLALRCGSLINGLLDEPLADQLVTLQAGRIISVESFGNVRRKIAGSAVMDLSSFTCLPGLINVGVIPFSHWMGFSFIFSCFSFSNRLIQVSSSEQSGRFCVF